MILALSIGLGAAFGSMLRYVVDQLVQNVRDTVFPIGTLAVNASGSFLLGLLTGLGIHHGLGHDALVVLGTGVIGGYTTLSTWAWESMSLVNDGAHLQAGANVLASVGAGLALGACGLALGSI